MPVNRPQAERERAERDRRMLILLLVLLMQDTDKRLSGLAVMLAGGAIGVDDWQAQFRGMLAESHAHAEYLGRRMAGDDSPFGADDQHYGDVDAELQQPFLDGFAEDIRNGRYDAKPGGEATGEGEATPETPEEPEAPDGAVQPIYDLAEIERRSKLYVARLKGTAEEAFALNLPEDAVVEWVLGPNEEHCGDCPRIAAEGPYTPLTLPTYPASGDTECMVNCKCHLRTSDGLTSFDMEAV